MILILEQSATTQFCKELQQALITQYPGELDIATIEIDQQLPSLQWDDVLVVPFTGKELADCTHFLNTYMSAHRGESCFVLPVAMTTGHMRPPAPIDSIVAIEVEQSKERAFERIGTAVGVRLALRFRGSGRKLFISYRFADGYRLATRLHDSLLKTGADVFLDRAIEPDGEGAITPGEDIQRAIERHIADADALVVLDTPQAGDSEWMSSEIDKALGVGVPIFAAVLRGEGDSGLQPGFHTLQGVGPVSAKLNDHCDISDLDLGRIVGQIEEFLVAVARRRLQIPALVEAIFRKYGFNWEAVDNVRSMYTAEKEIEKHVPMCALTLCSCSDPAHTAAISAGVRLLLRPPHEYPANWRFYIYGGKPLPDPWIDSLVNSLREKFLPVIRHHQQLDSILSRIARD